MQVWSDTSYLMGIGFFKTNPAGDPEEIQATREILTSR